MPMTREDRRKAIEFFVSDVFAPKVTERIQQFLSVYSQQIQANTIRSMETGMPCVHAPVILQMGDIYTKLIDHLCDYEDLLKPKQHAQVAEPKQPEVTVQIQ